MMDTGMFGGIDRLITFAFWAAIIACPLAIWKVIDIIIWLCHHVSVGVKP